MCKLIENKSSQALGFSLTLLEYEAPTWIARCIVFGCDKVLLLTHAFLLTRVNDSVLVNSARKFVLKNRRLDGKYFRLCGPDGLYGSSSTLMLYDSSCNQVVNAWAWRCANKTLFMDIGFEFYVILMSHKILFFFWFSSTIENYKNL